MRTKRANRRNSGKWRMEIALGGDGWDLPEGLTACVVYYNLLSDLCQASRCLFGHFFGFFGRRSRLPASFS